MKNRNMMNCEICHKPTTWKIVSTEKGIQAYCSDHGHCAPQNNNSLASADFRIDPRLLNMNS